MSDVATIHLCEGPIKSIPHHGRFELHAGRQVQSTVLDRIVYTTALEIPVKDTRQQLASSKGMEEYQDRVCWGLPRVFAAIAIYVGQ